MIWTIVLILIVGPSIAIAEPGEECTSDFSCGMGEKCIKGYLKSRGVCADVVDGFGNKRHLRMPELDSIGPKMDTEGMCQWTTDCPVGFRCQKRSSMYGYCVR